MKVYLKKLFVRWEAVSYPSSMWWRKDKEVVETSVSISARTLYIPSPDSVQVRGKNGKKSDPSRVTPAP